MSIKKFALANGFAVGTILLIILLIGAVVGAMALSNKSSHTDISTYQSKIFAQSILQEGMNLAHGFEVMIASGISPSSITWNNAATTGLFNLNDGGALPQTAPASALYDNVGWIYKKNFRVKGVGSDPGYDYVVILPGIELGVCQQINQLLYGSMTMPITSATSSVWSNYIDGVAEQGGTDTLVDLQAQVMLDGKTEACLIGWDSHRIYYKVVNVQ